MQLFKTLICLHIGVIYNGTIGGGNEGGMEIDLSDDSDKLKD